MRHSYWEALLLFLGMSLLVAGLIYVFIGDQCMAAACISSVMEGH